MTEKRFTIQDERVIKDNQKYVTENGYVLNYKSDAEEVCNLLNELYTKYVDEYALRETLQLELQRIEEENEQLKKEYYCNLDGLNYYQEQIGHLSSKISDLECENEQLKSEINMLKNTIGRNEAFIERITSNGEWNNTSMKQGDYE